MDMESFKPKLKILMFPWIAHGHISPYVELSKKLSTTNHFHIYICSTPVNLDAFKPTLAKHESITLVQLHMPSSPELPPEMHTTKNLPPHLKAALIQAFQQTSGRLSEMIESLKPDLVLYDLFQPWAPKIASSKGIPSVFFIPTSSVPYSFSHHLYTMGTASSFPFQCMNILSSLDENTSKVREVITRCVRDTEDDFMFGNFSRSTDVVLVNGCREMEGKYVDHLSVLCGKKVVCTGPLIQHNYGVAMDEEGSKMMKWLSERGLNSTVYISFGSECFLSKEQIADIAKALQNLLDINFIWALRLDSAELPVGFLEKVGERALVVKWAPQTKILAHGSVGAFVSHCGWNSIMESVYLGVPIVGVPMKYEQPFNARVAVEAGVAVEVEKGSGGLYGGEDLAGKISKVMMEKPFCDEVRSRAKMLREKIRDNEGNGLEEVVVEVSRICGKKVKQVLS